MGDYYSFMAVNMNTSRFTNKAKPKMIYRINPEHYMVIDCKINDGRRRKWLIYKWCSDGNQASQELMRLQFAEQDKTP